MKVKTSVKAALSCDTNIQSLCNCGMNDPTSRRKYPQIVSLCESFLSL